MACRPNASMNRSSATQSVFRPTSFFSFPRTRRLMWSQIATTSPRLKFSKTCPYAFTEHGALMAANVLSSPEAVKMSVHVVRAFIKQRELLMAHSDVLKKLAQMDAKLMKHDEALRAIWQVSTSIASRATSYSPPATRQSRFQPSACSASLRLAPSLHIRLSRSLCAIARVFLLLPFSTPLFHPKRRSDSMSEMIPRSPEPDQNPSSHRNKIPTT